MEVVIVKGSRDRGRVEGSSWMWGKRSTVLLGKGTLEGDMVWR